MRVRVPTAITLTMVIATGASAASLPFLLKDGQAYVAGPALERDAGIVLKKLPGRGDFIACGAEGCAPVKSVRTEGDTLLVSVADLSAALNLQADLDEGQRKVDLRPAAGGATTWSGPARVGTIAPNLRFTKLDGTPVALDELRGQRVLINSWASW